MQTEEVKTGHHNTVGCSVQSNEVIGRSDDAERVLSGKMLFRYHSYLILSLSGAGPEYI